MRDFIEDAESVGRISPGVWWCVHDMTILQRKANELHEIELKLIRKHIMKICYGRYGSLCCRNWMFWGRIILGNYKYCCFIEYFDNI